MPNSMDDRLKIARIDKPIQIHRIDELEELTTLCLARPGTVQFGSELAISLIDADEIDEDEDDDTDTDDDDDEDFDADGLDEDEDDEEDDEDGDDEEVEAGPDSE